MKIKSTSDAAQPNPALEPLKVLIGEWETVGKHPLFPGKILNGRTSFKWLEGGAFLIMHSSIEQEGFPVGTAIFGSDDTIEEYAMIYFDERKVSRIYQSSLKDNVWKWWRNDPEFSQRFSCAISDDGNTIIGKGEMSKNGGPWENDLDLTYTRIR